MLDPAAPKRGTARLFSAHFYCGQTVAHFSYCWALVQYGGRVPSSICYARVWTTHEEHSVVLSLSKIWLSIICKFLDFASLASKSLFTPLLENLTPKWGGVSTKPIKGISLRERRHITQPVSCQNRTTVRPVRVTKRPKKHTQKAYCGKLGIRSHHPRRGITIKVCMSGNLRGSSKFHISSKSVKQLPRCVRGGNLLHLVALAVGFYSSLYYHNHTSCDKSQIKLTATELN